jgi:hypothetical protein
LAKERDILWSQGSPSFGFAYEEDFADYSHGLEVLEANWSGRVGGREFVDGELRSALAFGGMAGHLPVDGKQLQLRLRTISVSDDCRFSV